MKIYIYCILSLISFYSLSAQQQYRKNIRPTKNVIVMIPDGASLSVLSAARWYKIYNNLGDNLAVDSYLCGTVKTFSSDAPIGDSAPTTSCYMTGIPQQTGNVSIYPVVNPGNDLIKLDSIKKYQPLTTVLEAAKYTKNKATGLVVTCEFPHATPADCASHYYNRGKYEYIVPQMVHNNLDVMFGGGVSLITDDEKKYFANNGTTLIMNDIEAFRNLKGKNKAWALFDNRDIPYDIDRDTTLIPSLSEMTQKAIEKLSLHENGFFLMVEGSKIDWAAHGNDVAGIITEYLAFDKAVEVALEFAKKDGNTTVVVLPDHGNSGFSIGRKDMGRYDTASLTKLFDAVSKYKRTASGLEKIILNTNPNDLKSVFKEYTGIDLNEEEFNTIKNSIKYVENDYTKTGTSVNLASSIAQIMRSKTYFGFTSGGHTGEEVFLAVFHPQNDIPVGMNLNTEINQYLTDVVGLDRTLNSITDEIFAKHTDVFKGMEFTINSKKESSTLTIKKGKKTMIIPAFKSEVYVNDKIIYLKSVTVYIDKNNTFYLPANLKDLLN